MLSIIFRIFIFNLIWIIKRLIVSGVVIYFVHILSAVTTDVINFGTADLSIEKSNIIKLFEPWWHNWAFIVSEFHGLYKKCSIQYIIYIWLKWNILFLKFHRWNIKIFSARADHYFVFRHYRYILMER